VKWPLLLLLATLPLQWFVVAGPLRLHIVVMVAFLGLSLVTYRARVFLPVLRLTSLFVVANCALNVVWLAAAAYHGLSPRQPVQQLAYLGVFVAVGTVVHRGLTLDRDRWIDILRWSALVVSIALIGGLSVSMALNDVNAATVFARTIAAADPEILQKELYRAAFTGFGFEEGTARGNLRHEVFGAVLVAMTMSAACADVRPFRSRRASRLYLVSMALATALILMSLSRSVIIALAVWPLLAVLRAVLATRVSPRLVGGALLGAGATVLLMLTGTLTVLWVRFTQETGSYTARDNLLERAFENIGANAVMGGVATASASSHNFVLDSWLRAGIFAAVAATVITVLLLGLFLSLAGTLHLEPAWMLPVAVMFALPLVRIFTAGGGLIPPVSWVGLGLAAGFLAYRRAQVRADAPARISSAADRAP